MRATHLKILLLILTTKLFSQVVDNDSIKIVYAEYDSIDSIHLVPLNALNGDYDLLIIGFDYDTNKVIDKRAIEISWPSLYIDGNYDLVITPKQIYLRSGHNNPNPNYLYWITSITRQQYDFIKYYLNALDNSTMQECTNEYSYRQSYFYNKFKKEKYVRDDWTNMRYDNFVRILKLINKSLKSTDNEISIPDFDNFKSKHSLRLVFGLEELDSQIKMIKLK
jgi:hypothetical protein